MASAAKKAFSSSPVEIRTVAIDSTDTGPFEMLRTINASVPAAFAVSRIGEALFESRSLQELKHTRIDGW
ncbi:hypothetical protein [Neoaquamicrobium sediminum]|uniref:hypothetical protein n=1 Tax=Neoaquamicrobium sediminum TaxID=1849104 RepID=UPI0040379D4C